MIEDISDEKTEEIVKQNTLKEILSKSFFKKGIAVSIFSFGFNFLTTAEYVFFGDIFRSIGFNNDIKISTLLTTSLIALCIGAVIGGFLSDNIKTSFGRRIPFLFLGIIFGALLLLSVPLLILLITDMSTLYYLILSFLILSHLFLGGAYSPWLALIAELFSSKEKTIASIIINILSAIGAAIAVVLFSMFIDNNISWLIWIITACSLIISTIASVILLPRTFQNNLQKSKYVDLINIPKIIWKYGGITWSLLLLVNVFWSFSSHLVETSLVESLIVRFNVTSLKASLSSNILMGFYIVVLLLPIIWIINKLGKLESGILTSIIYSIFCLLLVFQNHFNSIYFIMIIGGVGNILLSTLQIALPAECVPEGREASFMGFFFVFGTGMKPLATFIRGLLVESDKKSIVNISNKFDSVFLLAAITCLLTIVFLIMILKKQMEILLPDVEILKNKIGKRN